MELGLEYEWPETENNRANKDCLFVSLVILLVEWVIIIDVEEPLQVDNAALYSINNQ